MFRLAGHRGRKAEPSVRPAAAPHRECVLLLLKRLIVVDRAAAVRSVQAASSERCVHAICSGASSGAAPALWAVGPNVPKFLATAGPDTHHSIDLLKDLYRASTWQTDTKWGTCRNGRHRLRSWRSCLSLFLSCLVTSPALSLALAYHCGPADKAPLVS